MLDLTKVAKSTIQVLCDAVVGRVDSSLVRTQEDKAADRYKNRKKSLGAGSVGFPGAKFGDVCERALFYEYKQFKQDPSAGFNAKTYRIFSMGHDAEDRIAQQLQAAGFYLVTENDDGCQFGFERFHDPDTGEARMRGFLDGIFMDGPESIDGHIVKYPFIWENKALNDKKWKELVEKGVKRSHPKYYAQMQIYMGAMGLTQNPGLLTAMNRNTGELHCELVEYNERDAQSVVERAGRVITTKHQLELPRINNDYEKPPCSWCAYKETCKKDEEERQRPVTSHLPTNP